MWLRFCESFMKFLQVAYEELRIQDVYPLSDIHIVYNAKSMFCIGKPKKSIKLKNKLGGAQLQYETKFPLNFHEIPSSGLVGVTDTRRLPPLYICC